MHPWRRSLAALLALGLVTTLLDASFRPAPAYAAGCGVIGYSYEPSGRLAGVFDQIGQTARYQYDLVGNTTSVQNLGSPTLSVHTLSPTSGPPGTAVTISGGCFSTLPAVNQVRFGGVQATVTASTVSRVVALVPPGAVTGQVSVTINGATAFSSQFFSVTATPAPLAVTGVTPTSVNRGATITITGTGFDTDVSTQFATINGMRARVLAASTTQLSVEVPATTSGQVLVRTSRGVAPGPFLNVAPTPFSTTDVVFTGRASTGTPATLSIPVAGKVGVLSFDLAQGERPRIALSAGTFRSCGAARVLDPRGTVVASAGCVGASGRLDDFIARVPGTYQLVYAAADTATGRIAASLDATVSDVSTVDDPALTTVDESESWTPDRFNLNGHDWRSQRADSPAQKLAPLVGAPGGGAPTDCPGAYCQHSPRETAVAGQVLLVNGRPLRGVTLRIGERATRSDRTGRFRLTGLTAGHHELIIDGRTASRPGRQFGVFEAGVDVVAGRTSVLPYTIWMTRLDTRHAVSFPSPTTVDTVLTTPAIPGFEVRLPKGSVVRDDRGRPVTTLSITPIPVDRPPFPLPPGVVTPVYFTVQPGGSYVYPRGAQIVYPNSTGLAAGTRVEFWDYDPEERGWHVYGRGKVTADRRQIVPDPGVRVYEFTGSMINVPGLLAAPFSSLNDFLSYDGDPVDLATGLFHERHTDLTVPDIMPISVTRTYRQLDTATRPFGIGTNHEYGIFLQSNLQYVEADLVFPDSSKVHFVRTSPGSHWTDAVFAAVNTTGPFRNATMFWNGNGWDLKRTDGLVYVFGAEQPLQAIRDRHGNQITLSRTNGQGGSITQVTSPSGRWIRFSYDAGNRITQAMDDSGRTVSYAYDVAGRLAQVSNPFLTKYFYDSAHRMTAIIDPRNLVYLTNTYDANGKVASQKLADGTTTYFSYSVEPSGYNQQTIVYNPDGTLRVVVFDANHYEAANAVAYGTPLQRTILTVRDPVTRLVQYTTGTHSPTTTFTYDGAGKVTSATEYANVGSGRTTWFAYGGPYQQVSLIIDWGGRQTTFGYNAAGDLTAVTDTMGRTARAEYDGAGRPTKLIDPLGNQTTTTYVFGEAVATTDPLARTTRTTYDRIGRPIAVTDPTGAVSRTGYHHNNLVGFTQDPTGATTGYSYDGNGNLTSVVDPLGRLTEYFYDLQDRVYGRRDALGFFSGIAYDTMDRVTADVDARGRRTTFEYDALGRSTFVRYGVTSSGFESWTLHEYDSADRIWRVSDTHHGTTTYTYDALDQVTSVASPNGVVSYTYDAIGRRLTMTVPGAPGPISYGYNLTDQLTSISQGTTSVTWQRDGAGRTSRVQRPGVVTTYGYDAASQLTGITHTTPSGVLMADLAYGYDANGRVATMVGSLATVTIPGTSPALSYNSLNQLVSRGGGPLSYDAAGNLLSDGTSSYVWDARGRLTSVSRAGMTAAYTYDGADRRTQRSVNGVITRYLYDGPEIVHEWSAGTGNAYRIGGGPDTTVIRTEGSAAAAPLTDRLGSVVGLVDTGTSSLSTRYWYDPHGGSNTSGVVRSNTQRFTGREYDAETGLQNHRARYYSPALGRFISPDPAEFGGGSTNLYEYAHSDPVNFTDPDGDMPLALIAAFAARAFQSCMVGGLVDGFTGVIEDKLAGRKHSVGDTLRDFGQGCLTGMVFSFGAWAGRVAVRAFQKFQVMRKVAAAGGKAIVFGEDMIGRVKPAARNIGATWYKPWKKHFAKRVYHEPRSLARNAKAFQAKIQEGYTFFTTGISPTRAARSPYWLMETRLLGDYPVTRLPEWIIDNTWWWP